jgi:hypothetical protein
LNCRESAAHILSPIYEKKEWAFFTNGDDDLVQRIWAREHGISGRASLSDILKAQLEEHRSEVFYNLDITSFERGFAKSLPGCVKKTIAWHAAPLLNAPFTDYDLVICNFPSILRRMQQQGCRTDYFAPAHDPELGACSRREDRPIDVLFVGGYSRHHMRRAEVLETVATLYGQFEVAFHLDRSRLCRIAESPLGYLLPLAKYRRPAVIQKIAREPLFGRDLYELLSSAKIVLNGAIDMAGRDRGNLRCFEALGSGALLLSDDGNYPEGMRDGETLMIYRSPEHAVEQIKYLLSSAEDRTKIARAGQRMVTDVYSKARQWERFERLV